MASNMRYLNKTTIPNLILFLCLLYLAAWANLLIVSLHGINLSPDSLHYAGTSQHLLSGKLFVDVDNSPFVYWPPLYPILLSLASLPFNGNILLAGWLINFVITCSLVVLTSFLFVEEIQSKILAFCGVFLVVTASPLFFISVYLWSELFFILLITCICCVITFSKTSLLEPIGKPFILLSGLAALCCLQRYMGVTVVLSISLYFLLYKPEIKLRYKLKSIFIFLVVSVLPITIWVIRNYILTHTLTGPREVVFTSLLENIFLAFYSIGNWFLPLKQWEYNPAITVIVLMLFLFLCFLGLKKARWGRAFDNLTRFTLLFLAVYVAWLILSATLVSFDAISDRLLVPVYIPLVFLILKRSYYLTHNNGKITIIKPTLLKTVIYCSLGFIIIYSAVYFFQTLISFT